MKTRPSKNVKMLWYALIRSILLRIINIWFLSLNFWINDNKTGLLIILINFLALTPWNAILAKSTIFLSNNSNFLKFQADLTKSDKSRKNTDENWDSTTVFASVPKFVASTRRVWKMVSTKFAFFSGFKVCRIVHYPYFAPLLYSIRI